VTPENPSIAEVDGIEIRGSPAFIFSTRQALEVAGRTQAFSVVRPFIAAIKEARYSGMSACGSNPTYCVGKATWQSSPVWYASTIVHDGYHSKLYRENRRTVLGIPYAPRKAWTGKLAEQECLRLQLNALCEMGADPVTQQYVRSLLENPTYHKRWFRTW
jgi:hypothetical protein